MVYKVNNYQCYSKKMSQLCQLHVKNREKLVFQVQISQFNVEIVNRIGFLD